LRSYETRKTGCISDGIVRKGQTSWRLIEKDLLENIGSSLITVAGLETINSTVDLVLESGFYGSGESYVMMLKIVMIVG
jgi:hypothetical protein